MQPPVGGVVALERNPSVRPVIAAAGHDVLGHGNRFTGTIKQVVVEVEGVESVDPEAELQAAFNT